MTQAKLTEGLQALTENHVELLQDRSVRNLRREVFLAQTGKLIIKRYTRLAALPDRRPLWDREHRTLLALGGDPFSESYGWTRLAAPERNVFVLVRSHIDGSPLPVFTEEWLSPAVDIMLRMHSSRILSCDPAADNFLVTPSGTLTFLDFSRARHFPLHSPLMMVYIGKELARFHRTGLRRDERLWIAFLGLYMEKAPWTEKQKRLIQASSKRWVDTWQARPA